MAEKRKTIPSVLLIILSTLGILVGLLIAGFSTIGMFLLPEVDPAGTNNQFTTSALAVLALTVTAINVLTLIIAIRKLSRKTIQPLLQPKLVVGMILMVLWWFVLAGGYLASRSERGAIPLAILTSFAVIAPIWLLVNIAGAGLPRSTRQREMGTLTIGLTVAPVLIIIAETIVIAVIAAIVIIALGFQGDMPGGLPELIDRVAGSSGGISELEDMLFNLMRQPLIAAAVFISLGFIAPLIEEIFKPMAIWFLLKRPLKDSEGYILGLISGGAFALLESAGMVIQMNPSDWLAAVGLRAATGVLHIGLSGLVGFGMARSWTLNKRGRSAWYILAAAILHGAWNSLALYSGYAAIPMANGMNPLNPSAGTILSFGLMLVIFSSVVIINIGINRFLRKQTI